MARHKAGGRTVLPPPLAQVTRDNFWTSSVLPFLKRRAIFLVLALVAIASIRIVTTYNQLSLTFDEPAHIACGMEYVAHHVYRYESQHPPISRAMVAIGPYFSGARPHGLERFTPEGVEIVKASPNPDLTVRLARAGTLPFFWLACWAVYLWGARYFGAAVAVLATGLFSLLPPVLAHAGLATTDMALTASLTLATFSAVRWGESPTWTRTLLMGLAGAFAMLSKFSALGYLPAGVLLCAAAWLAFNWPGWTGLFRLLKERAPKFAAAVAVAALAIWVVYWFSFGRIPETGWSVPAPEFFDGIRAALRHNTGGHPAYLLGETSDTGWWYFFPVALAVKTPIAFLVLVAAGLVVCCQRREARYLFPLAIALGILAPAMTSHVNIGVRHILPIYCMFSLVAAIGLARISEWSGTSRHLLAIPGVLGAWLALSGASYHPDYLAYFNAFAAREPEAVLVDSDLDWGQEIKGLSKRLQAAGAKTVSTNLDVYFSSTPLYGLPPSKPFDTFRPAEGWNVVSPTAAKHTVHGAILAGLDFKSLVQSAHAATPWYERIAPTERVGALKLYYIPPGFRMPGE